MCNSHMFALSDSRDYSFSKVFGTRKKDNRPAKLRKRRDVILLLANFPRPVKKMADKRGKKLPKAE